MEKMRKLTFLDSSFLLGTFYILVSSVLFASKGIFIKQSFVNLAISPINLMTWRMLFSLPLFWIILLVVENKHISRKLAANPKKRLSYLEWFQLGAVGLCGYYLASLFDFIGLQYISAGLERILLYSYPSLVLVINSFRQKKILAKKYWIILGLMYIGMVLSFSGDLAVENPNYWIGVLAVLFSSLLFAWFVVLSPNLINKAGNDRFTAYAMTISTLGIILHMLVSDGFQSFWDARAIVPMAIYLAIFGTVLPVYTMILALKKVGSTQFALMSGLGPVAAILMGWVFLNETTTAIQGSGMVLVLITAVMLGIFKDKKAG